MNPFLFLFYIAYLTPSLSGRSIISQNPNPKSTPQSHHESPPAKVHRRSKRSLTAFLAAEVLFLEGLLAAQNSRKPRKISRPVQVNTIDSSRVKVNQKQFVHSHQAPAPAPAPQVFHFRAQPPQSLPVSSTTVSSLDPFIMLSAPDLSKKNHREHREYQLFPTKQTRTFHAPPGSFSPRKPRKRTLHYGAFELYHL